MNFMPVYKRELRSYFTSPIAYVVLTFFILITSFFFYVFVSEFSRASMSPSQYGPQNLNVTLYVLRPLFGNISVIMLFVMPLVKGTGAVLAILLAMAAAPAKSVKPRQGIGAGDPT